MSTVMVPANAAEALRMLQCAAGFLAGFDSAGGTWATGSGPPVADGAA